MEYGSVCSISIALDCSLYNEVMFFFYYYLKLRFLFMVMKVSHLSESYNANTPICYTVVWWLI